MDIITSLENCKIWILLQAWKIVKYGFYYKLGKKWNWPNLAILTYHKGDVGVEDLNEGVIEAEDDINP